MKFLCPQCKAKYRIADEKLAQRASSRMKCRKCGHVIDIHSALVPDSIRPPGASADDGDDEDRVSAEPPRAAPAAAAPISRRAAVVSASAKAVAPKRPAAAAPKRPAVAPPRRGAAAVAAVVPEKAPLVEATPAPAARVATTAVKASPARNDFEEEAATRIHDGAALAAAFSKTAERTSAPPASSSADEWYVGIDGTPTGPLGTAQLQEKAKQRKVTLESLVWRDGFEEWKPINAFPELVTLLEEALREAPELFDPRTIPAPSPYDEMQAKAAAAAKAAASISEPPSEVLDKLGVKPRKTTSHAAAWVAVFVALAFGVTIGAVLLSKTEKQEVVKYVEVPASAKANQQPAGGDPVAIEESTVSGGGTKRPGGGGGAAKPEASAAPTKSGLTSLTGLNGLNGLGPSAQGPDVAQGNAPGGQLDGNSIQRVVANFAPSVRRGCWDTALSSRAADAPSSARVGVTITIAPGGNVTDVSTTGDPRGYPSLAHCIESKVRAWHFPPSGGTTTANVPFVFAAQ